MKNYREDDPAIISRKGGQWTYGQICEVLRSMYYEIQQIVDNGSGRHLCVLISNNRVESILRYLLCIRYRIPLILLDMRDAKVALENIIDRFQPSLIWIPEDQDDFVAFMSASERRFTPEKEQGYWHFFRIEPGKNISGDLALMLTTSGSTGAAKYVCLSYQNLEDNAENIACALKIRQGERAAVMLPISYSYGLSVVNSYLCCGGTILIPDAMIAEPVYWDFLRNFEVNALCGVPYTYEIMDRLHIFRDRIVSLEKMTQAGGKLGDALQWKFASLAQREGFDFYIMYGQTEATARMSCFCLSEKPEKQGSVGRAIPGGSFLIVGETGEIVYSGKNIFLGYAETADDLGLLKSADVLYTGDIGHMDSEGYLYITGRKKRIVKLWGMRVALDQIETRMQEQTGIAVVCVKADGKEKLLVYSEKEIPDVLRRISMACGQRLLQSQVAFHCLEKFPRKENGKLDYQALCAEKNIEM